MTTLTLTTHSPEDTAALGERLGRLLRANDVLLLQGPLGAGKTRLTQGLVRGVGGRGPVTSPTFVLVNEYRGPLTVYHVDLYRLERATDVDSLGLDEYFEAGGVTVVEWPERAWNALPDEYLLVQLDHTGDADRSAIFTPHGPRYEALVAGLNEGTPVA